MALLILMMALMTRMMALMTRMMALMTRMMALMTRMMALMTRMMALMTRMMAIAGMTSLMTIQKSLMQGLTECFLAIHKFQIQVLLTKLSLGLSGLQNCFTCSGVSPCEF